MANTEQLLAKINNKSQELNANPQTLLQMYFYERLLYRISKSTYKHNFILKGGLLLSAIVGRERRTSNDMDTLTKNINLENLIYILNQICKIECDDGITFHIVTSKKIRIKDIYGGLNISIIAKKEQLEVPLTMDVTTKDPVTPHEIEFGYKSLLSDEIIYIMAFTKETIIAEKFQILIEKMEGTNRIKDFFDLYILITEYWESMDENIIKMAIINTFQRRKTLKLLDDLESRLEFIQNSNYLAIEWRNFQISNPYAKYIDYSNIIDILKKIAKTLSIDSKKRKLSQDNSTI